MPRYRTYIHYRDTLRVEAYDDVVVPYHQYYYCNGLKARMPLVYWLIDRLKPGEALECYNSNVEVVVERVG